MNYGSLTTWGEIEWDHAMWRAIKIAGRDDLLVIVRRSDNKFTDLEIVANFLERGVALP